MLPLMIDVENKEVAIVGGGRVALRKLSVFLKHGARIKIISPHVIQEIEDLHAKGRVTWIKKEVDQNDLLGAFIVIAATDQRRINDWVRNEAGDHQLVCVADQGESGNLQMLSYQQKGDLTVSVSTNGSSPIVAKRLCETFIQQYSEEFIEELSEIGNKRKEITSSSLSVEEKKKLLKELADCILR